MENLLNPDEGFYLEDWFVDPALCLVSRAEKQVRLEPKVMDVLVLLALNQNRVLRKDEIIGHVWGDVNVVENVLTRAVSQIRKVFDNKDQSIIQTIPKVGYRLIANVSPNRASDLEIPAIPAPGLKTFARNRVVAAVAILFAVAVLLVITAFMSAPSDRKLVKKEIILLHKTDGPDSGIHFSTSETDVSGKLAIEEEEIVRIAPEK